MASATFSISNMAAHTHTHTHTHLPSLPRLPSTSHFSSSSIAPALARTQRLTLVSSTTRAKFDKFQGDDSIEPDDDAEDPQQPQFELSEEEDDRCT